MTNEEFIKSISLEEEEWRDVVGYEGLYMVSSLGRIISLGQLTQGSFNSKGRMTKKRILKSTELPKAKHRYVTLCYNKAQKKHYVHRLVAIAFIPNDNNYPEIDHLDRDPSNNKVSNLKWCTRSQNLLNPNSREYRFKLIVEKGIAYKPKPLVAFNQVETIHFRCTRDAQRAGFTRPQIKRCCEGKIKFHKGYQWMYLSDYEKITNKSKNDLSVPTDNT